MIGKIIRYLQQLIESKFTGWFRVHLVGGLIKKVEKGESIDLK